MDFDNLSPELQKKAKACKSPEELLALANEDGYELSDEDLDQISGGAWGYDADVKCPFCASHNIEAQGMHSYKCLDCNKLFSLA